jgi:trans-aconitate 2-methyltransferase
MWDPDQYRHFGDERSRPFFDLLARVAAKDPAVVVDLGCGPGTLTAELARRWPAAEVRGVDSSPQMIEAAQALPAASGGRLSFALGDVRDWEPDGRVDVIVSNAVLQWVPGHLQVLARWASFLNEGGWLAIQVPGNFDQPSHTVLREMAGSPRWRSLLAGAPLNRSEASPAEFLDVLAGEGFDVDAWETTYLHVLHGENAVVDWYKGTALRPVLAALDSGQAAEFLAEYRKRIAGVYPAAPYGTPFPFRRVFAVGHRPSRA